MESIYTIFRHIFNTKKGVVFFSIILLSVGLIQAVVPEAIKYQAVVRDNSGNVIPNRNVGVRLSILKDNITGTAVYIETHASTTNNLGLINLEIGKGTAVSGVFSSIDWGGDDYFIKIEIDENGGSNYSLVGVSQLVSVPYSLFAKKAGNGTQWSDTINSSIYYKTGNVGIGTDNPHSPFEVRNNQRGGSRILITGNVPELRFGDTTYSNNGVTIGVAADSNDLISRSGQGDLVFTNEAYGEGGGYIFGTGVPSYPCVKITDDCKVGIGTDVPVSKLQVKGGDINIEDIGSGVVMKSPDGNCWRMSVSNSGQPVFTSINCLTTLSGYNQSNSWGAVASYPFNGNANDTSGNGFNGTIHNATLATDRNGNANSCYFFTGYNAGNPDYIELPTLQSINNTNEISISVWLKADQTNPGGPTPFTLMPDNSSDRLNAHINYAPYTLYWDNGNISNAGRVYTNYTASYVWDHFVFIKSTTNNKMQVYKNNVLIIDANQHSDISNKNRNIRIGGGAGGNQYFTGWIDDLKIFNRALTATEVNQIYNAER